MERIANATAETREEIEVTPEMVEAGLEELYLYSSREDSVEFARNVVESIYLRMMKLRRVKEGI